eukprot:14892180-Heterocapsa_arctica.AAC.1
MPKAASPLGMRAPIVCRHLPGRGPSDPMLAGKRVCPLGPTCLVPTGMAFLSNPGTRRPAASNPMPEANFTSLLMCERRR